MKILSFLLGSVLAACGLWFTPELYADPASEAQPVTPLASLLSAEGAMPPLEGAVEWLNSKPLSAADLQGKVVLVDFWTYSCINWHRTLPHVSAWADKYRGKGLVVIGVHSPEFEFEKDIDRVREAARQLRLDYPVAVDSNHAIWRAFRNAFWPALYLVDANGMVRHRHFGEGDYERSERVIQQLLIEAGAKNVESDLVQVDGQGSQAQADWSNLRSPETYIGHARAEHFASPGGIARDQPHAYEAPKRLRLNSWALAGNWTVSAEAATSERASGRLVFRFQARDLHLVMGPAAGGKAVPFRVLIDGKPPGPAHGTDVDADGKGVLIEARLYQLIRQTAPITDQQFEIEFLQPGASAYSFTFG